MAINDKNSSWEKFGLGTDVRGSVPIIFDNSTNKFRPATTSDYSGGGGGGGGSGVSVITGPLGRQESGDSVSVVLSTPDYQALSQIYSEILKTQSLQFGLNGTDTITDGNLSDVDYYSFKAITDSSITSVTLGATSSGDSEWAGKTIYAGDTVILDVKGIEFSGTIQFFKNVS